MKPDICWSQIYGPISVVKSITKAIKKHPMFYLDVEQFSAQEANTLYLITSENSFAYDPEKESILKRIYQDRDLNKLTEKDLSEWFKIKIMGPVNLRTTLPKSQVREFAVYKANKKEWAHDQKTGNLIMTEDRARSLINSIFDEELILMQVIEKFPARKSFETRSYEAKIELNNAMDSVADILHRNDEASINFMTNLTAALKRLKEEDANKNNVSDRDSN